MAIKDPPIKAQFHLPNGTINPIWVRWFIDVANQLNDSKQTTVVTGVNFGAQTVTTETINYVGG